MDKKLHTLAAAVLQGQRLRADETVSAATFALAYAAQRLTRKEAR